MAKGTHRETRSKGAPTFLRCLIGHRTLLSFRPDGAPALGAVPCASPCAVRPGPEGVCRLAAATVLSLALMQGALTGTARAQTAPDAGTVLREQERLHAPQILPSPAPEETAPPPQKGETTTGATITIQAIHFTGRVDLLSAEEQKAFVATTTGQRLGLADLRALTEQVTALLQKKGHVLARAVLPPQDVTAGAVDIAIVSSTLEAIDFQTGGDVRITEGTLHRQAGLVPGAEPTGAEIESALLRLNDLPGLTVRGQWRPGIMPNTSRLTARVEEAPIPAGLAWGGNYGQTSTGRVQGNALLTLSDVTGWGEQTRLQGTVSEGMRLVRAGLAVPFGALTTTARYTGLTYKVVEGAGTLANLEGSSHQAGLGLDYGFLRSRAMDVHGGVSGTWKALIDDSVAGRLNDKRVWTTTLFLNGTLSDPNGTTAVSVNWTGGRLDLSRVPESRAVDAATLDTHGAFHHLNVDGIRIQRLAQSFSLQARVSGQWGRAAIWTAPRSSHWAVRWVYGLGPSARGAAIWECSARWRRAGTFRSRPSACTWPPLSMAGTCGSIRIRAA
ncbi:MAG: hypothetical protein FD149_1453 [Rhodospirillaceae bacterium]|nr:MAG: hypothetical protein FD149_1453 [Rhodospirillaceae bacterium]